MQRIAKVTAALVLAGMMSSSALSVFNNQLNETPEVVSPSVVATDLQGVRFVLEVAARAKPLPRLPRTNSNTSSDPASSPSLSRNPSTISLYSQTSSSNNGEVRGGGKAIKKPVLFPATQKNPFRGFPADELVAAVLSNGGQLEGEVSLKGETWQYGFVNIPGHALQEYYQNPLKFTFSDELYFPEIEQQFRKRREQKVALYSIQQIIGDDPNQYPVCGVLAVSLDEVDAEDIYKTLTDILNPKVRIPREKRNRQATLNRLVMGQAVVGERENMRSPATPQLPAIEPGQGASVSQNQLLQGIKHMRSQSSTSTLFVSKSSFATTISSQTQAVRPATASPLEPTPPKTTIASSSSAKKKTFRRCECGGAKYRSRDNSKLSFVDRMSQPKHQHGY